MGIQDSDHLIDWHINLNMEKYQQGCGYYIVAIILNDAIRRTYEQERLKIMLMIRRQEVIKQNATNLIYITKKEIKKFIIITAMEQI